MNYMFYESTRIVEKQEKHEKSRAYDLIESLEKSGLDNHHLFCALELMSKRAQSEFESAVILKAKQILIAHKEKNETDDISIISRSSSCVRSQS